MLLSEYFYDTERLEPEIQDKLQAVLKDWQGVFLDGKGTTVLSVIKSQTRKNNGIQYHNKTLTTRKSSLRERKKHTDRAVSSTPSGPGRGTTHLDLWPHPCLDLARPNPPPPPQLDLARSSQGVPLVLTDRHL